MTERKWGKRAFARTGKTQAERKLFECGRERAWELYCDKDRSGPSELSVLRDIIYYLTKNGRITEKQIEYLGILTHAIDNQDQVRADRAAERATAEPVPTDGERHTVSGMVLKQTTHNYGGRKLDIRKMTVLSEKGYIVCGSVPAALGAVEHGDLVSFTAVFKVEKDKFGWFLYPRDVKYLGRKGQSAEQREKAAEHWLAGESARKAEVQATVKYQRETTKRERKVKEQERGVARARLRNQLGCDTHCRHLGCGCRGAELHHTRTCQGVLDRRAKEEKERERSEAKERARKAEEREKARAQREKDWEENREEVMAGFVIKWAD